MPATENKLPFSHLNLRRNPFGSAEISQRPAWAVVDIAGLPERLRSPGFVVQVVGERGHGKTTHLMAIRAQLPAETPYFHLKEGEAIPRFPDAPILLVDETQRMTRDERRRLFQKDRSCAIGTHEDHSAELDEAGLEYVTIRACGLSPVQLQEAANRRIETARRNRGPVPTLSLETAEKLVEHFGGDVRQIEHRLYEMVQQLEGPADARM